MPSPNERLQNACCLRCLYWAGEGSELDYLSRDECRRWPPKLTPSERVGENADESLDAAWPRTYGDDWCGAFERKKRDA